MVQTPATTSIKKKKCLLKKNPKINKTNLGQNLRLVAVLILTYTRMISQHTFQTQTSATTWFVLYIVLVNLCLVIIALIYISDYWITRRAESKAANIIIWVLQQPHKVIQQYFSPEILIKTSINYIGSLHIIFLSNMKLATHRYNTPLVMMPICLSKGIHPCRRSEKVDTKILFQAT